MMRKRPGRDREAPRPVPGRRGQHPGSGEGPWLVHHFQGVELLDRLLARAGATVDAKRAIERFASAIREGRTASEVIPGLFPAEPRFAGPEDALALYGNLLGAWDLLEDGVDPARLQAPMSPEPFLADAKEEPAIVEPRRGSIAGPEIPRDLVDATWRWLDALPNREKVRRRDRFENAQPDLAEWVRSQGLPGVAQDVLERLVFELSEMVDRAFGDRYGLVPFRTLGGALPQGGQKAQPAVAAYVDEVLAEVEADAEAPIEPGERVVIERRALQALAAMVGAIGRTSPA